MRPKGFRFAGGSSSNGTHTHVEADVTNLPTDLAAKAASSHSHAEADVTSLTTDLAGKAASAHSHAETDVTNLTTDLSGKAASAHTHTEGNVTNLTADLAAKAATTHSHAESDVTSLTTDLAAKAASTHTHAEADVTSLTTDLAGKAASAHTHALAVGQGTPATAAGSLTAGSVNVVAGTLVSIPTGSLAVGSRFRFHVGLTKTAAGTATWTLTVRFGTAGNNTDALIASWTSGTNTALADRAILIVEVVVASTGASATANCLAYYVNQATDATGLGNINPAPGSTATFNSPATSPFLHVDVTPGASAVMTGWGSAEALK